MTLDRLPDHPVANCEVNTALLQPQTQSTRPDKAFVQADVNCLFVRMKGRAGDPGVEWNVQTIPGTPDAIAVGI